MKPGSAGPGVPGIHPIIYDEDGNEIPPRSGRAGNICIQNPWPGAFQTIWKDPDRYVQQYYARYCKDRKSRQWRDWPYFASDGALQAADGYYRILGRIDDVINVAGHRLGTKEIESASLLVGEIAEAAVVPARDEIKSKVPDLYVSLKPGIAPSENIRKRVEESVIREIGAIARPRRIVIVPDMPKTRSGKIMRRVLAALSNNEDAGDVSTLANPEIVYEIRELMELMKF
jgi:acetyl-CoA synthetase